MCADGQNRWPKISCSPTLVVGVAGDVLRWAQEGSIKPSIHHVYPLEAAAQAHEDLASRKTAGKLLLRP